MKRINKKQSTQTDGSDGEKMSVEDQAEISRHIDIKMQIGNVGRKTCMNCASTRKSV